MDYAAAQEEPGYQGHYGGAPRDRDGRSLSPRDGVGLADGLVRLGPSAGVPRPQRSSAFSRTTRKTNHFAWPRDLSEIFDGDAPFTPRGCIAQAWTVGEVLRGWRATLG